MIARFLFRRKNSGPRRVLRLGINLCGRKINPCENLIERQLRHGTSILPSSSSVSACFDSKGRMFGPVVIEGAPINLEHTVGHQVKSSLELDPIPSCRGESLM